MDSFLKKFVRAKLGKKKKSVLCNRPSLTINSHSFSFKGVLRPAKNTFLNSFKPHFTTCRLKCGLIDYVVLNFYPENNDKLVEWKRIKGVDRNEKFVRAKLGKKKKSVLCNRPSLTINSHSFSFKGVLRPAKNTFLNSFKPHFTTCRLKCGLIDYVVLNFYPENNDKLVEWKCIKGVDRNEWFFHTLFKNLSMLSVRISSCGCTREVWRARKMRKSSSRRSREQL